LYVIIAPDSVSALIAHQQGQRKRKKGRTTTEFSCLVGVSQCRPLLPDTFIGCIIADKYTTASDTNKNDNHWLKKCKDIWDLQRELIKSKRLARRQMPWWYYYNYQRNKPMHTELLPSNLTVVQLDMKLPSLDHAHVTVSTVDSTTAIKKTVPALDNKVFGAIYQGNNTTTPEAGASYIYITTGG